MAAAPHEAWSFGTRHWNLERKKTCRNNKRNLLPSHPLWAWRGLWLVPGEQLKRPGCCIFTSSRLNLDVSAEVHTNNKDKFVCTPRFEWDRKLWRSHDSQRGAWCWCLHLWLRPPCDPLPSLSQFHSLFLTSAVSPCRHLLSAQFVSWWLWRPDQVTRSGWDQWETLSPPLSSCWAPRSLTRSLTRLLTLAHQWMESGLGGDGCGSFGQMDDCHWWEPLRAQFSLAQFTGFQAWIAGRRTPNLCRGVRSSAMVLKDFVEFDFVLSSSCPQSSLTPPPKKTSKQWFLRSFSLFFFGY